MNIFLFDKDLKKNAEYFKSKDPKRFNKQIVESTQLFAASYLHYYKEEILKADGTPYIVNRIKHHPAYKFLLKDIANHYWHEAYLRNLLLLFPNHACNKSIANIKYPTYYYCSELPEYLCLTNSDMTGLPKDASVFDKYKRHLENKLRNEKPLTPRS